MAIGVRKMNMEVNKTLEQLNKKTKKEITKKKIPKNVVTARSRKGKVENDMVQQKVSQFMAIVVQENKSLNLGGVECPTEREKV